MGSCATREHTETGMEGSVIPEPRMFRNDHLVVLHYSTLNATTNSFEEFLKSIPNCVSSEIAEYKTQDKEYIVVSGIEHSTSKLSYGIIIETMSNSFVVQVGSVEVICLLLKSEDLVLVSSSIVEEKNYARNFQSVIESLYKNSLTRNDLTAYSLVNEVVNATTE